MINRASDDFFVEGPEILETAAAAGEEDEIEFVFGSFVELIEHPNRGSNFQGCALALDSARGEDDLQRRIASLDDMQDVANGCANRRGHETDSLRILRQCAFAFFGEQAFGAEFLLEAFKRELERAQSLEFGFEDA